MKKHFLIVVLTLMIFSCGEDKYQQVIKNKDELIKLSLYQDITNDNDRNYYELVTYTSDYNLSNQFIFKKEEEGNKTSYSLRYDSIQFTLDSVIGIDLRSNQYEMTICSYYEEMSQILKPYKIKSLVGKEFGRDYNLELTVYFEGGGRLEYYPKGKLVERMRHNNYNYKKIAKGWYLLK